MKVPHINYCPICHKDLEQEEINSIHSAFPYSGTLGGNFICLSPLANDPLHYYAHIAEGAEPSWISFQEFTIDLGSKYVIFRNDYEGEKSSVKSNKDIEALSVPFLTPDFPNLESLRKKIKLSITFS